MWSELNLLYMRTQKCSCRIQLCGSQTSKEIMWAIRMRLCKACRNIKYVAITLSPVCLLRGLLSLVPAFRLRRPDDMDSEIKWADVVPSDGDGLCDQLYFAHA